MTDEESDYKKRMRTGGKTVEDIGSGEVRHAAIVQQEQAAAAAAAQAATQAAAQLEAQRMARVEEIEIPKPATPAVNPSLNDDFATRHTVEEIRSFVPANVAVVPSQTVSSPTASREKKNCWSLRSSTGLLPIILMIGNSG